MAGTAIRRSAISGSSLAHPIWTMMVLHPAYILRGKWGLDPAQPLYIKRLLSLIQGEWEPPAEDPTLPPPSGAILLPTVADLWEFSTGIYATSNRWVAPDIETAGPYLVGIGFCRFVDMKCLYLPFRREKAQLYWSEDAIEEVVGWLYLLLKDPEVKKVFQNGQAFDLPYLQEYGFEIGGYAFDTLIAQHTAYPEMPKDLQFIANLYAGLPAWKYLTNIKEEGEGK